MVGFDRQMNDPQGGAGNTELPRGLATQRTGLEFGMTSHNLLTSPATEATPADLAALDQAYRERMDACRCPYCNWAVTA